MHEAADLSAFLLTANLALGYLDWRYVPLLWLSGGFLPEVWTLISARQGETIWEFLPAFVALADLCITIIPLISIAIALAGTRTGGLLWWSESCPCKANASWAHRFGWLDIVGAGDSRRPSPSEPLLPNLFGLCRRNIVSENCGIVDPGQLEGALRAPEGVSQFSFILFTGDVASHGNGQHNTTGSYATVPAFSFGSMRNVE